MHVPFCLRHCPYCDFTVAVQSRIPATAYVDQLIREFDLRAHEPRGTNWRTLYLGGGTPSLLPPSELGRLLDHVGAGRSFAEVTLEANPERLTPALADGWRAAGFTRVSLGVQSLRDEQLRTLGRVHCAADVLAGLEVLERAGFAHVSVDLIFGVPGQQVDELVDDIGQLSAQPIDHLSLYELTWEPGTSFDRRRRRGLLDPLEDGQLLEWSNALSTCLSGVGFEQYEVSNFARPGGRAVHNAAYWSGDEYLGLGVGASGMVVRPDGVAVVRRMNGRSLRQYLEGGEECELEALDAETHMRELLMTGLRTSDGVDLAVLEVRLGLSVREALASAVSRWVSAGWVLRRRDRVLPTLAGMWQADRMAEDVFAAVFP